MNRKKLKKGITLIETVLLILVIGTVAFISAPLIDTAIESWSFVTYRSELWQDAELSFSRMTSEIKEIKGSSGVITANSSTFQFVTVTGETISYSFTGSTLSRNGNVLANGVNAFSFSYFDSNLNPIGTPLVAPLVTNIRAVRIYMVVGPTGRTFTLQTDVHPRNID